MYTDRKCLNLKCLKLSCRSSWAKDACSAFTFLAMELYILLKAGNAIELVYNLSHSSRNILLYKFYKSRKFLAQFHQEVSPFVTFAALPLGV